MVPAMSCVTHGCSAGVWLMCSSKQTGCLLHQLPPMPLLFWHQKMYFIVEDNFYWPQGTLCDARNRENLKNWLQINLGENFCSPSIHKRILILQMVLFLALPTSACRDSCWYLTVLDITWKGSQRSLGSVFWLKFQTWRWEGQQVLGVKNKREDLLCLLLSNNTSFPDSFSHFSLAIYYILCTRRCWEIHF